MRSHRGKRSLPSRPLALWEKIGLSAATMIAVAQIARRAVKRKLELAGKVVLITGSRGLGLALAYEFGQQGARVALCARLATELRGSNVHVLTAVPGLMRTGSYLNAKFKGNAKQEFAWFGVLGNLPGFSVAATYAARCIREALERGRYLCTISLPAKILVACEALLPETTRTVLSAANRFLMPDGESKQSVEGHALDHEFGRSFHVFTLLGQRAANALNEQS